MKQTLIEVKVKFQMTFQIKTIMDVVDFIAAEVSAGLILYFLVRVIKYLERGELANLNRKFRSMFGSSQEVPFDLLKFQEHVNSPIESNWSLRILHPKRSILRCTVQLGNTKLPFWDKPNQYFEKYIPEYGGANVRIPTDLIPDGENATITNGKTVLISRAFKDIPEVDP
jgi:hypothetical protein